MKTIRISVREELVEYQDIEVEVADDFDHTDVDAMSAAAEAAFESGEFKALPHSNRIDSKQRMFFAAEAQVVQSDTEPNAAT